MVTEFRLIERRSSVEARRADEFTKHVQYRSKSTGHVQPVEGGARSRTSTYRFNLERDDGDQRDKIAPLSV